MDESIITSLQNPRVKAAVAMRQRRSREKAEAILIDGEREVRRAFAGGVSVREVFYCTDLLNGHEANDVLDRTRRAGAQCVAVARHVMEKLSYGDRCEGILAIADRPDTSLPSLPHGKSLLVAVIERLEKPGNLGAILRSADAAGVDLVIAADPVTDIYGPNVIRSSVGTAFTVPLAEAETTRVLGWLAANRCKIAAAVPEGGRSYTEIDMTGPTAIALGAEADGLTEPWRQAGVVPATIPMHGIADSLNVSITAALFFFEALRQRDALGSVRGIIK